MGSKGGGGGPQESTVTQTNLPEYAEPFYRDLLARVGYESATPYETYQGPRLAYFDPAEQEAMRRFEQLGVSGTPPELDAAGAIAAQVGAGNPYADTMLEVTRRAQEMPGYASTFRQGNVYTGYDPRQIRQSYTAGQDTLSYVPGPDGQFGPTVDYEAGQFDSGYGPQQRDSQFTAQDSVSGYEAGQFDPGYQAGDIGQGYQAGDLQSGYSAGQFDPGYEARGLESLYPGVSQGDFGPGFQAGTVADASTIESYMSPYQQLVVDREKDEARRQSEIMEQNIGLQASQVGGLGGYREAIMQAERQRNLEDQMGDIQAAGSQQAFTQAQQAFEADRAARLQEGQMGLQMGQAFDQSAQQAEQFRQSAYQAGEQARQQAAQMGLTAQQQEEAARQAEEQFKQSAFSQTEGFRQQEQQFELGVYQAGEQARQQAAQMGLNAQQQEEAARQAQEQFRQGAFSQTQQGQINQEQLAQAAFNAGEQARQQAAQMGLNAQQQEEAARQAQQQFEMQAFESGMGNRAQFEQLRMQQGQYNEQARQRQMELNLSAYQANQQARQQAAQMGLNAHQIEQAGRIAEEQARRAAHQMNLGQAQTAAQLGQSAYSQLLGGDQQRLAAAGQLGGFVQQRQAMEMERLRAMQAAGQINRELRQRGLDIGYSDFLRQQAFPKEQLSFYSSMLQGIPITPGQVSQAYGVTPSLTQQLLGSGIAGVGLYNAFGG